MPTYQIQITSEKPITVQADALQTDANFVYLTSEEKGVVFVIEKNRLMWAFEKTSVTESRSRTE